MITRILALALAALPAMAQDARQIVRMSLGQYVRNDNVAKNYTYKVRNRIEDLDSAGKVKAVHSTLDEVLYIGGRDYYHPLEKDGRPLPPNEAKKEEDKLDRAVKEASALTDDERRKRDEERAARRARDRDRLKYVPDAFDFTIEGDATVDGRDAWRIRALPRADYKGPQASLYRNMEGTLWIDKRDYQWVKVEADVLNPISLGLFLARIDKGTRLSFERAKVNGELWAPTRFTLRASARLALVKKFNGEQEITFSDYRRFSTDAHIVNAP